MAYFIQADDLKLRSRESLGLQPKRCWGNVEGFRRGVSPRLHTVLAVLASVRTLAD
jgi:hypothetical protein